MPLTFLGAVGTVTGSRTLIELGGRRILVDCGMFQGLKQLRLRNWKPFPVPAKDIDAVLLTHAHIDHSGYLPRLCAEGFRGPIHCTHGTKALAEILLPDAARLQEEEARFLGEHRLARRSNPAPLFTVADAELALRQLVSHPFRRAFEPLPGVQLEFRRAGHILGAASLFLRIQGHTFTFSGDLGRPNDPLLHAPDAPLASDWMVLESTYGDRLHAVTDPRDELEAIVRRTIQRGGIVLVPSFAVGRTQLLLLLLRQLIDAGRIPALPIFVDSPMATSATKIYESYAEDHRLDPKECQRVCALPHFVRSAEESQALAREPGPMIVISASGMATGGRVLHHLAARLKDPKHTIAFVGYQAPGTRGADLVGGRREVKLFGQYFGVQAEVVKLDALSAHADQGEIIGWLKSARSAPRRIWLNHGEAASADALRRRIQDELGWSVEVPEEREAIDLWV